VVRVSRETKFLTRLIAPKTAEAFIVCLSDLKIHRFKIRNTIFKRQKKFTYGAQEMAQKLLHTMQSLIIRHVVKYLRGN